MLSHGLVSAALFLCVGVVYDRVHTRLIDRYGGLVHRMPLYAVVFMVFTLANVGLPGTSGFVGEFLILIATFKKLKPTVVGLSCSLSHCYPNTIRISRILRQLFPDIWIVVGGHITSSANVILKRTETDICIVGDGEIPWVKFLDYVKLNPKNHQLDYTEMWVQQFADHGGGHHETHVHWDNHISGFYFLKCSDRTSVPVFHDPRAGRMMLNLPIKDHTKLC